MVNKTTVLDEGVSQIQVVWENKHTVGHQNSQAGKTSILQTLILTLWLLIKHSKILKIILTKEHLFLANKIIGKQHKMTIFKSLFYCTGKLNNHKHSIVYNQIKFQLSIPCSKPFKRMLSTILVLKARNLFTDYSRVKPIKVHARRERIIQTCTLLMTNCISPRHKAAA